MQLLKDNPTLIAASIIDEHKFKRLSGTAENRFQPFDEQGETALAVIDRDNDAKVNHRAPFRSQLGGGTAPRGQIWI